MASLSLSALQLAAGRQRPPKQKRLWQSLWPAQARPRPHAGQTPPPQSVSVSAPFFALSKHEGKAQRFCVHALLWQSAAALHDRPVGQRGQAPPPQSTSVSAPFFTPSLHAG